MIDTEIGTELHRINIKERETIITFKSQEKPIKITLDPNNCLLAKIIYLN